MSFSENSEMRISNDLVVRANKISKLYNKNAQQSSLREMMEHTLKRWLPGRAALNESDQFWALKEVSFEVRRGEALGILGPNGAGKSTLLKVLSRITRPTSGSVSVNGRLCGLLELGAGFHPELTGRENIYLYGSILGMSRQMIGNKFDEIVQFSGIEPFIDMPVKRYSSGMFVRLGFSVAAHTNPELLLVDEVLAVGDAEFRQKCIEQIKHLLNEGVSTIFISHNLFQMRSICERGIFLNEGKIQYEGNITDAVNAYENWLRLRHTSANGSNGHKPNQAESLLPGSTFNLFGLDFYDLSGRPRTQFEYSEGIDIRVHFSALKNFANLNFVIRIYRSDGLIAAMLRSADLGFSIQRVHGKGIISLKIRELQLVHGIYTLEVRIRDSADAVTLAHLGSGPFQVNAPGAMSDQDGVYLPHLLSAEVIADPLLEPETGRILGGPF